MKRTHDADLGPFNLGETYVLDIEAHPGSLSFRLDVVLWPDHPEYEAPPPDSAYCYRLGFLRFEAVTSLEWSGQGRPPATDATGARDFGQLDVVSQRGSSQWALDGDFGHIEITARAAGIDLDPR